MRRIERGAVYDGWGNTVGFRCSECGAVYQSMWGNTCNGCRKAAERHQELLQILKDKK